MSESPGRQRLNGRGAGSIRGRIALSMLLSAVLLVPVLVLSVFYISQMNSTVHRVVKVDLELARLGDRISLTFLQAQQNRARFLSRDDSADLTLAGRMLSAVDSLCDAGTGLEPALAGRFSSIRAQVAGYRRLLEEPGAGTAAVDSIRAVLSSEANGITEYAVHSTLQDQARARQLAAWGQRNIITVLLLVVVLLAVLVGILPGRLVMPVKRMANALNRAEQGSLDVHVDVETRDELGQLGRQLNRVFARLREFDERKAGRIKMLEHRFRLLAQDIAEGVLVVDRTPNIIFANPAIEPLLGMPGEEATGRALKDIPNLAFLVEPLESALAGATSHQECGILPGLIGSAVCIETLTDSAGTVFGVLVVVTNPAAPEPPTEEPAATPTSPS